MAEEAQGQDKSEEATPRKREKAREEGQAARSRELNTMTVLVAGSVAVLLFGKGMGDAFAETDAADRADGGASRRAARGGTALGHRRCVAATLPLLVLVFVVALVSSGALGGFVFSTKVLGFKASRMNPLTGLQRMFSMKALIELAKAIAKFLVVAGVAYAVLQHCSRTICCAWDSSRCLKRWPKGLGSSHTASSRCRVR